MDMSDPYFGQSYAKEGSPFGKSLLHVPVQRGICGSSPSLSRSVFFMGFYALGFRYSVGLAWLCGGSIILLESLAWEI